ncbi:MAG: hypothetical protein EOO38_29005 [Cytophagaceae bacterium]|nr:MAG: hypothetical protein EOO38_29005 [Cytophagaceae bacterium]
MPFEKLQAARGRMKEEQWRWLYVSLWFGLRPMELDRLAEGKNFEITNNGDIDVLWIEQLKLSSVSKEDRWKNIPVVFPQQQEALAMLKLGVKRPLVKTIQKHVGPGINTYGGRKAFSDMMTALGQDENHVSRWLGHATLQRTKRNYVDKKKVEYKKAG